MIEPGSNRWTLADLLAPWAARRPDAVALRTFESYCTYAELHRASLDFAAIAAGAGVAPGERVAILSTKSFADVIALLGTAMAGGTYVPLDPASPRERTARLLREVDPRAIVLPRGLREEIRALSIVSDDRLFALEDLTVAGVGDLARRRAAAGAGVRLPAPPAPDDVAYILYTSGSTGGPKGVQIEHRSLGAYMIAERGCMPVDAGSRVMNMSPFFFDVSVDDVLFPLCHGAEVWLTPELMVPRVLLRLLASERITHLPIPMSKLALLTGDGSALASLDLGSLRFINTGAERVDPRVVNQWLEAVPGLTVINGYGPTEATNQCLANAMRGGPQSDAEVACIGRPLAGMQARLIDGAGRVITAPEATGELVVAGPQVMRGYWRRPDEDAAVLVDIEGTRHYRTGDLCTRAADGRYTFIGRRDEEVKVAGHRIHLKEVEAALAAAAGTSEVVVSVLGEGAAAALAAAVAFRGPCTVESARGILRALAAEVPAHMVPGLLVLCEVIPRLPTGKADARRVAASLGAAAERYPGRQFLRADGELRFDELPDGVLASPVRRR